MLDAFLVRNPQIKLLSDRTMTNTSKHKGQTKQKQAAIMKRQIEKIERLTPQLEIDETRTLPN